MKEPKKLSISTISYSTKSIEKYGINKHIEAVDFRVMLMGYAIDDGEINVVDFTKNERVSTEVVRWLKSPRVIKHAFNVEYVKRCVERRFRFQVADDDFSWKSTDKIVKQYALPADEMVLSNLLGFKQYECSYIDVCLQRFCEPEHISVHERRIFPQEFPALWRNVVKYCKWLVYAEKSIREHLRNYPVDEMVMIQEELSERYKLETNKNEVAHIVSCPYLKYIDETKLYRAIRFVIQFNQSYALGNLQIMYKNKCLWIISNNGSFAVYLHPGFDDEKWGLIHYEHYCAQEKKWVTYWSHMDKFISDINTLMERDYRVLIAMQCSYRNISAKVTGEKIYIVEDEDDKSVIDEIIERTRIDV